MRWKSTRVILFALITIFVFWFVKFCLSFPNADVEIVGIILTISSILFGLLAGFFISELWSRYTEIRELQGVRSSEEVNMIRYAKHFLPNRKFEREFKLGVEKASISDEVINWDEGHLEAPYFQDIEDSFKYVKVKNRKDNVYFDTLLESYNSLTKSIVRLDVLYKERLFLSEWIILFVLSLVIAVSILFLDASHFFSKIIIIVFPAIIALALSIVYDLDRLTWGRELITLEPTQRVFDAIGVKRFYLKKDRKFVSKDVKDYRTEDDLKGDLKKVYLKIISSRKK